MNNLVLFGSIEFWDLLAVGAIVLILAGSGHWPEFRRGLREGRQEFLRSSSSVHRSASIPTRWEFGAFVLLLVVAAVLLGLCGLLL